MGGPSQIISKLVHGDMLQYWPKEEVDLISEKIHDHILRCQYDRCKGLREFGISKRFILQTL